MHVRCWAFFVALSVSTSSVASAQLQGGAPTPPPGAPPPTAAPPGTAPNGPYASPYGQPYGQPYGNPSYPYPPNPYGVPPPNSTTAPKELDYDEGQPIPPGYHLKEKVRLGPVIGGACSFGVLWLISVLASSIGTAVKDDNVSAPWVPVIGPFITLGKVSDDSGSKSLLVIDGVGQALGAGLLIWGLSSPKTVLLRNDLAGIEVHALPMVSSKSAGFGLGAVF